MSKSHFSYVRVAGMRGIVPANSIDIDEEIAFYGGNARTLQRNKAILGLGRRHVVDEWTTLADLAEKAAGDLLDDLSVDRSRVETLIVA